MPIYEYVCSNCGKVNDVLQKMSDPAPEACEACQQKSTLSRVVSRTSFVLKGGGWYSDLYSSKKKDAGASSSSSGGSSSAPADTSAKPSTPAPAPAPAASSSNSADKK